MYHTFSSAPFRPPAPDLGEFQHTLDAQGLTLGTLIASALRDIKTSLGTTALVNEEGGCLSGVLVSSFAGLIFAVFGGDLVTTESGPGLVMGGVTVG